MEGGGERDEKAWSMKMAKRDEKKMKKLGGWRRKRLKSLQYEDGLKEMKKRMKKLGGWRPKR